jgi:putative transcriptional regulator
MGMSRARMEKNLEDMMGDDWRTFRARLVAQEQAEEYSPDTSTLSSCEETEGSKNHVQLGSMFAGAISSLFSQKKGVEDDQHESIFDGHHVGFPNEIEIEDPFASADEIVAVKEPSVKLDRNQWAHPITHVEPGCVLLANEKLGGVFHQTVVLIIDHNEARGSTGIVINRPLPGNLLKIASETVSHVDLSLKLAFNCATVSYGGPVMQEDYSVLHGYGEVEGSKKVAPGIFVGGSRELMDEVRSNNFDPHEALFIKGHAAWVPSQLSREISKGVWYMASASPEFILRYAGKPQSHSGSTDLWSDILSCMGKEHAEVAERYAGTGDKRLMP